MKKNVLGRTGIAVSELSHGTLIMGRNQANMPVLDGARAIARALDLGINFFDTAASYGTQPHVREGLKEKKDQAIISTKTHMTTPEKARQEFETSLRELDRDYIDLYQFHLITGLQDMQKRRGVLDFFLEQKQKGRIRAIGASVHQLEGARAVVAEKEIDVLFPIEPPVTLAPGECLLLVKDLAAVQAAFSIPAGVQVLEWGDGKLANSGETLVLSAPGDENVDGTRAWILADSVTYSDGSHPTDFATGVDPWPLEADGRGSSLQRIVLGTGGRDPAAWRAAPPSPGVVQPGP